ncbi:uncharacterized protein BO72DRAFT_20817 [Aspergillus fijiensis CBS 313.89]|uniref:Uncharacterized protein n=1 Tax=Aspergillus fijiensis CBS 313.89 TaxID=1448319 RepID=A0A8G1RG98_9EURO|nr:uncharacterized protein BO72DRAFT_20817 [Aspergillus fijiensis CBS 313.89]RAK71260.1 hypothetical protein BO72DRAFT_20817 [Aspergillus fijiensis CBS 313.89]
MGQAFLTILQAGLGVMAFYGKRQTQAYGKRSLPGMGIAFLYWVRSIAIASWDLIIMDVRDELDSASKIAINLRV